MFISCMSKLYDGDKHKIKEVGVKITYSFTKFHLIHLEWIELSLETKRPLKESTPLLSRERSQNISLNH